MTGGEAGCGSADSADENARTVGGVRLHQQEGQGEQEGQEIVMVRKAKFVRQVGEKKTLAEHLVK